MRTPFPDHPAAAASLPAVQSPRENSRCPASPGKRPRTGAVQNLAVLAGVLLALLLLPARGTAATTRTVATLADDTNPNDGVLSLREAIAASVNGDVINFSVTGTITLTSGELLLGRNLTITGPSANVLTVSGNNASRVFNIPPGITVNISNLTISHGRIVGVTGVPPLSCGGGGVAAGDAQGGGILNQGNLFLKNCALTHNSALGGDGGTPPLKFPASTLVILAGTAGVAVAVASRIRGRST